MWVCERERETPPPPHTHTQTHSTALLSSTPILWATALHSLLSSELNQSSRRYRQADPLLDCEGRSGEGGGEEGVGQGWKGGTGARATTWAKQQ